MRPRNIHSSAIGSARAPTVPPVACLRLLVSVVLLCVAPFAHAHLGEEKIDCAADGSSASFRRTLTDISPLTRRIETLTGCPNHVFYPMDDGMVPKQYVSSVVINGWPTLHEDLAGIKNLSMVSGPVGMMINGVAVYSSYAGEGAATTYGASATKLYADDIDLCGGSTDHDGIYHYHNTPGCLQEQAMKSQNLTVNDHSPVIGWAFDGFPIYGQLGPSGVEMLMCGNPGAHEIFCLDECGGYFGNITGVDGYLYRYYMTCGFDESYFPFTINCYRGCCDDEIRCEDPVTNCYTMFDPIEGYTDDYDPFYIEEGLPAVYNDTDLIEGDDFEQVEKMDSMDCSFYVGSAEPNPSDPPTPAPTRSSSLNPPPAAPPLDDDGSSDGDTDGNIPDDDLTSGAKQRSTAAATTALFAATSGAALLIIA